MVSPKLFECCFLAALLLWPNPPAAIAADLNGDAQALLAFKGSVTSADNLPSWTASTVSGVCLWRGVICRNATGASSSSLEMRIVELHLPGSSLTGSIPPQTLGKLDALQVLSLRKNRLSGTLPSDLANCVSLRLVNMESNILSGPLSFNFTAWPLLQSLDLSTNELSGEIPASVGNLTQLNTLNLEENAFSGSIPPNIGTAPALKNFNVSNNRLSGSIPSSLSNFTANSFLGNAGLCGRPLSECPQAGSPEGAPQPMPETGSGHENTNAGSSKLGTGSIVGIVLAASAVSIIFVFLCFLLCVRKSSNVGHADGMPAEETAKGEARYKGRSMSRKASGRGGNQAAPISSSFNKKLVFMGNAKQTFDLDDLLRASAEVLGKGSLGTSYKANIDEGHPLCVKRFRQVVSDRERTCQHIEMLGSLKHPNLVPLRAYFFAPKGKLLVSDYMPKGSLSSSLHGNKREIREPLGWESRLAIAYGAAKGLLFLHSKKVIHGNIKASNVVMDDEGEAHLTDYSLIQLIPLEAEPGVMLKPNAFTPPEFRGDLQKISYKGDVYAFGVLLLELVTGKSPNNGSLTQGGKNIDTLVQWVEAHFPNNVEKLLDKRMSDTNNHVQDEMIALLRIAMPCVSAHPENRPHMVEVESSISNLRKRVAGPKLSDFYSTQAE